MKLRLPIVFLVCASATVAANAQVMPGRPVGIPPGAVGGPLTQMPNNDRDRNGGLSGIPPHFFHVPHFEPSERRFPGGTSGFAHDFEAVKAPRPSSWFRAVGEGGGGWLKGLLAALSGSAAAAGGLAGRKRDQS
jgi:hypothetical protein